MSRVHIAAVADIPEGTGKTYEVNGHTIALFHIGETFYALDDTCSHAVASLGAGEVDSDEMCVSCPRHGAIFDLETGKPRTLPATKPVATYKAWVEDDAIVVELSR